MNFPTHHFARAKAERPVPDWRGDAYKGAVSKPRLFVWQSAAPPDLHTAALAKHFWRFYLYDLVSRGEFEMIEKSWSGASAVRKLEDVIIAPANPLVIQGGYARIIQGSYAVPMPTVRPALELVSLEAVAREARVVPAEFIPSRTLVDFWQLGLRSHLQEFTPQSLIEKMRGFFARQNHRALAEAFAKKLTRMLSVLANRQKHGLSDYHMFSERGRFSIAAQHQLLDRFPIIPDEATEFFQVLHTELMQHLEAGGVIQGRWGKLLMKGGGLVLRNDKRAIPAPSTKWKVAKVLE